MFTSVGSKAFEEAKHALKKNSIIDIYELPDYDNICSDEGQLQWLDLLHGSLCEADAVTLNSNPQLQESCEQYIKESKEAEKRHEEETREREEEKKLIQGKITILEQKLEFRASRGGIVSESVSINNTMKVEQDRLGEREFAMTENGKRAKQVKEINNQREIELEEELQQMDLCIKTMAEHLQRAEKTTSLKVERLETKNEEIRTKLESKKQSVDTSTGMLEEKERNVETPRQQVEELKTKREEYRATDGKEKRSLLADMTKKLESKQERINTMTHIAWEKDRNEMTLRTQVEELKKGSEGDRARFEKAKESIELKFTKKLEYKEQLVEQLERETWQLRNKIQLESEARSVEQKRTAEKHQRSFNSCVTCGKQARGGKTIFSNIFV